MGIHTLNSQQFVVENGSQKSLGSVSVGVSMSDLDWVPPARRPGIWIRSAAGTEEEQYFSKCFRSNFTGANHQAGFSPWHAIGWFNAIYDREALGWLVEGLSNCVKSHLNYSRRSRLLCWRQQLPLTNVHSTIELCLAIARLGGVTNGHRHKCLRTQLDRPTTNQSNESCHVCWNVKYILLLHECFQCR